MPINFDFSNLSASTPNFSANNLTIKRPGNGISPMQWDRVIGQRAKADFKKDELIEL